MPNLTFSRCDDYLDEAHVGELLDVTEQIFGSPDALDDRWRLSHMPDITCFEARDAHRLVGYKIGYAHTSLRYYSWLGGVHPDYRRRGIADELMRMQHAWLTQQSYTVLETEVRQANQAMRALNTRHGFEVIGSKTVNDNAILIMRRYF